MIRFPWVRSQAFAGDKPPDEIRASEKRPSQKLLFAKLHAPVCRFIGVQ
jgi:hypothetical protein